MGGRGSSSQMNSGSGSGVGRMTGLDMTYNGETTRYYFAKGTDGTNYYQEGIGGNPEPTPLNMSPKEFRKRAESNGATFKTVSQSEYRKDVRVYEKDRKATDKFLNNEEYNKHARKSTRNQRLMDRAQRKRYR